MPMSIDELAHLCSVCPTRPFDIRAIFRLEARGIGLAKHIDGFQRFRAGPAENSIYGLRVEGFESAWDGLGAR